MRRLGVVAGAGRAMALEQEQQLDLRRPHHPSRNVEGPGSPGTYANPGGSAAACHTIGKCLEPRFIEGEPFGRARFDAATLDQDRGAAIFRINAETVAVFHYGRSDEHEYAKRDAGREQGDENGDAKRVTRQLPESGSGRGLWPGAPRRVPSFSLETWSFSISLRRQRRGQEINMGIRA